MKSAQLLITSSNEVVWSSVSVTDSKPLSNQVFHTGNFEDGGEDQLFTMMPTNTWIRWWKHWAVNTNSPWLGRRKVGDIHAIPVSHGMEVCRIAEEFAELSWQWSNFTQYDFWRGNQAWIQNTTKWFCQCDRRYQVRTVNIKDGSLRTFRRRSLPKYSRQ